MTTACAAPNTLLYRSFVIVGVLFSVQACGDDGKPARPLGSTDATVSANDGAIADAMLPGDASTVSDDRLWCAVAEIADRYCLGCHGEPLIVNPRLRTYDDWLAPLPSDNSVIVADQAVINASSGIMPPPPELPLSEANIDILLRWQELGTPEQPCADDAGVSDGGFQPLTGSGEEIFKAVCARCHGEQGEGTALAYEIQHPSRAYSRFVVRSGRPGAEFPDSEMSAYPETLITDEKLEEIWDYLDSFPQPTTGEGLYLDYCRNCHGENARGGVSDRSIDGEDFADVEENVRQGNGGTNYADREGFMNARTENELSDAELQQIADYLDAL